MLLCEFVEMFIVCERISGSCFVIFITFSLSLSFRVKCTIDLFITSKWCGVWLKPITFFRTIQILVIKRRYNEKTY